MTTIVNDPTQSPLTAYNIKCGVPQLHITPYTPPGTGPAWDAVEGWLPLGLIEPGTLKFDFGKEKYDVMAGSPQTVKARFIVSHNGKVDASLVEIDARARELVLGHNIGSATTAKPGAVDAIKAATVPTKTQIELELGVPFTHTPVQGELVEITSTDATLPAGQQTRKVYGYIQNYAAGVITFTDELDFVPAAGDEVRIVKSLKHVIGGNYFKNYRARLIMSATDDSVQVIELLKVNVTTGYSPDFGDGKKALLLPLSLECIGLTQTVNGRKQVVLANHYEMPSLFLG